MEELPIYHGTSIKKADKIISENKMHYNPKPDHWLGNGIYFFENDYDAAKWWSKIHFHDNWIVLKYNLKIGEKELIDLDTLHGSKKFKEFCKKVNVEMGKDEFKIKISEKENRYINASKNPKICRQGIVTSAYLSAFYNLNHYKACVKSFCISAFNDLSILHFESRERQMFIIDSSMINCKNLKKIRNNV